MKNVKLIVVVTAATVLAGFAGTATAASPILKEIEDNFIRLGEEVRPCVVEVDTAESVSETWDWQGTGPFEELYRFFGITPPEEKPRWRPPTRRGLGSGFIYDKAGHVITNNHVIKDAKTIKVTLWDGKKYDAAIVGADSETDIAVIKIDADRDLPVARLGDSSKLKVGQFAIAVGSPRGFQGSLSFGYISALGRENLPLPGLKFQNLIQTDAAINLGNSGGPLCNIDGEVIGINVAIVWGAQSIGFAIPINTAKQIIPELLSEGKVTRGYLGVWLDDASGYVDAETLGLPDERGAFVQDVEPNTPAERAGLKVYDVIRKVNGRAVENGSDLRDTIADMAPSSKVMLEVWRDGKPLEIEVVLEERPADIGVAQAGESLLGLRVETLASGMAVRLGLEPGTKGALVTEVEPGSPADDAGIMGGDVILEVERQEVASESEFRALVKKHAESGKSLLLRVLRPGQRPMVRAIKIPAGAELE